MQIASNPVPNPGAEIANGRRPVDAGVPKDGPQGREAPEPASRGEAVVFGGSLGNSDRASQSRDSARQSRLDRRHDAEVERHDERKAERKAEAEEAAQKVDVRA